MIPRVVHFVFGLEEQREPFHFLHYLSVESCRRVLAPDAIYFHCMNMPWGPWWDLVEPHVRLRATTLVPEVSAADYSGGAVPSSFRYAHHADFIRLDAAARCAPDEPSYPVKAALARSRAQRPR